MQQPVTAGRSDPSYKRNGFPLSAPRQPTRNPPDGLSPGMREYIDSPHIAGNYDEFFAFNSLFEMDEAVLAETFTTPGLVIDLGCGTGRTSIPLARRGHRLIAVDLSEHMLQIVQEKSLEESLTVDCLRANLVDLTAIRNATADYAMCLFSTLGMIQGRDNRQRFLRHVHRILKPGGRLVLHIHSFWYNVFDPGGPWWILRQFFSAFVRRDRELGEKEFPYRGIPNMLLHVFRRGELTAALREAGFHGQQWISLNPQRNGPLRWPWLLGRIRANGWIVICDSEQNRS